MRSILIQKEAKKAKQKAQSLGNRTNDAEDGLRENLSEENSGVISSFLRKIKKAWDGE